MVRAKPLLRRVALAAAVALGATTLAPLPALAADTSVAAAKVWSADTTYASAGQRVTYRATVDGVVKQAVFVNAWWTRGDAPSFTSNEGPWKRVGAAQIVDGAGTVSIELTPPWYASTAYTGGMIVAVGAPASISCFKAKYWTQGFNPATAVAHEWETPWERLAACPDGTTAPITPSSDAAGRIDHLPPQDPVKPVVPGGTPVVPPVMPTVPPPSPVVAPTVDSGSTLPAEGYAFLRQVSAGDWDWLFPLRSGKYDTQGGTRNMEPIARPDGSTDTFTLPAFRRAVLEYNGWAKANNCKQFLNEGTLKQQSQEFLVFWAKSSRETSGSWQGAPAPWIRDYIDRDGRVTQVWKGALYWVEEVGYTSNTDGTSPNIGYVDTGSVDFPPVPGRSYHGRGVIQLSWNYNYGAFSRWLYDSGLMRDVITAPDTLLKRPDLVATNGALSILSGIWFWMTPQGQKPSSHDVLYGDAINISRNSTDRGLPQLRTGFTVNGQPTGPVATGDTTDEGVMAFRIGTIINIVNGGLECNGAASWHQGPPQRISYYNAYTTYFNERSINPGATRVSVATNIWNDKISTSSPEAVQSATCFNQKSYYGW
ncbi:glycoside hydrolase family 19 protein [Roseateles aquatilis]|nr:glycoside hydrolase family 19 protein [Roseateles aquatilis]